MAGFRLSRRSFRPALADGSLGGLCRAPARAGGVHARCPWPRPEQPHIDPPKTDQRRPSAGPRHHPRYPPSAAFRNRALGDGAPARQRPSRRAATVRDDPRYRPERYRRHRPQASAGGRRGGLGRLCCANLTPTLLSRILAGRNRLELGELEVWQFALAVGLFAGVFWLHGVLGPSPMFVFET